MAEDLCLSLLNTAQLAGDADKKIIELEQVKEILFNRAPNLLVKFAPDVFDFMIEQSVKIRKFLIQFSGDALLKEKLLTSYVVDLFYYYKSDTSENIIKAVVLEMTKNYERITINIANMKQSNRSKVNDHVDEPVEIWNKWIELVNFATELLSLNKSDSLRLLSIRFVESLLLFGLEHNAVSADPRLANRAKSSSKTGASILEIPLHHPFIDRQKLEATADEVFSKLELYASLGGPRSQPFQASHMSQLGVSIVKICETRNKLRVRGAKALTVIISGKKNQCASMSKIERQNLITASHSLIKSFGLSVNDESVKKLKEACAHLETLVESDNNQMEIDESEYLKPNESFNSEEEEEEEEDPDRSSHLAANSMVKRARLDPRPDTQGKDSSSSSSAAASANLNEISSTTAYSDGNPIPTKPKPSELILSADLGFFPSNLENVKLVSLNAFDTNNSHKDLITRENTTLYSMNAYDSSNNVNLTFHDVSQDVYSDTGLMGLKKLLEYIDEISIFGIPYILAHLKLSIRTAITMSLLDLQNDKLGSKVEIISLLPLVESEKEVLFLKNYSEIILPRPLWMYLTFAFGYDRKSESGVDLGPFSQPSGYFIVELMREIFRRGGNGSPIYEHLSCIIFSRLIQKKSFRQLATLIIPSLPAIPECALTLLKLVADLGTRNISNQTQEPNFDPKDKGTRLVAISYLQLIVIGEDHEASRVALLYLLWCAISSDFEVRSRAIFILCKEILSKVERFSSMIIEFAVHASLYSSGLSIISSQQNQEEVSIKLENKEPICSINMNNPIHVKDILAEFDFGLKFENKFSSNPKENIEEKFRRHFHLLFQLSLEFPVLLSFVVDLNSHLQKELAIESSQEKINDSNILIKLLSAEFSILISASVKKWTPIVLFNHIKTNDLGCRSLLLLGLDLLQVDHSIVAPAELVSSVLEMITREATPEYSGDMRLLAQAVSGLSPGDLENFLPQIIAAYLEKNSATEEDYVGVKKLFLRIQRVRPPLMTKLALLIFLHNLHDRYCNLEGETAVLKQKNILDCIEICIENTGEFKGWSDAIKEMFTQIINNYPDNPLPRSIMRTAIRSTQSYPDLKKYVLTTLMPNLMKFRVWTEESKIWDGIIVGIKALGLNKDAEPTLRAALGLPGPQLKVLVAIANNIKPSLFTLIKSFSKEEYFDIISGKWLFGNTYTDSVDQEGNLLLDSDKEKVIKMIMGGMEEL